MFANFIYFIVALLIYSTYPASEQTPFSPLDTLFIFLLLILLFTLFSRRQFSRIMRRAARSSQDVLDEQFSSALTRQSILAIALFAIDIYGLNLASYLANFWLFDVIPTLEALLFMALFVFYLTLVWSNAHAAYRHIYRTDISRRAYVFSNIAFSVPVLLPWLMLSGIADLILALPFEWPQRVLLSPAGETAYFFFFLFVVALVGPVIIQKFWRCRPLEAGFYRQRAERGRRDQNIAGVPGQNPGSTETLQSMVGSKDSVGRVFLYFVCVVCDANYELSTLGVPPGFCFNWLSSCSNSAFLRASS